MIPGIEELATVVADSHDAFGEADEAHALLQEQTANAWKARQEKRESLKEALKTIEQHIKTIKSNL